jgi:uncharacterized protein YdcH (DUF465 family)
MLGENHCLNNEFPELKDSIAALSKSDKKFFKSAERYHQLDEEIRKLELKNTPADDNSMHQLKQERANLKDTLYQKIRQNM